MNHMEDIKPDFGEPVLQTEESKTRHEWISVAAYYKAQARRFVPGLELDDWLAAEKDYIDMLIALYLSIVEEDGAMSIVSLRQLAKAIGVQDSERLNLKVDLIRAIQDISRIRPCFQLDLNNFCEEIAGCQWKKECQKIIAVWKR
jgi:hypothetical protein